uniref:BZIP domain-containing protein n=1 Tax=Opuntia streptacantha TaxID=393608 RepID=A0A7C9E424_OPUST
MASSSATSQNNSNSSEASDNQIIDIRKRKRMQSNRESARRSRQKKQKQLDDLTAEVSRLTDQNGQILNTMNVTTQLYMNVEAENSVLKAQLSELTNRLNSLNDIIRCLSSPAVKSTAITTSFESDEQESFGNGSFDLDDCFSVNSFGAWGIDIPAAPYPIMPSLDAFMC